ncbi:AAA family ATPase [Capnocytophaga leadbetteri]|uniref:AAA family ATPase n=1 Tax=Capnocytophaga leadbetteri TaxID=327575 RepID=UPI0028ECA83F|nr:AAA family ATPase [Capnocytophaga leadbetteri]
MNKVDLLDTIIKHKETIDYLIDSFERKFDQEEYKKFYEEINNIRLFLDLIVEDINNDIMPEFFFYKIEQEIKGSINIEYLESIKNFIESNHYNTSHQQYREDHIKYMISNYPFRITGDIVRYNFYKSLNFISENTVVVGANGSGKSTLATNIKYNFNEKIGIVIPAQKLLIIPTFDSVPSLEKSMSDYKNFETRTIDNKTTYNQYSSPSYDGYALDYKYILSTFFAEKISIQDIIYKDFNEKGNNANMKRDDYPVMKLEKAINIWNFLIEHREMFYDDNNLKIKVKGSSEEYPAYKMSDGEKNIFFLIGRVLLASDDAMIIIDEPEMYLHKAIVNKLWDKLEEERRDCKFIYLTHDLEFASSRKANKYWIKDFQFPSKWEIEPIPENDIPDSLLMKILGSRKKILFCEGKKSSLDIQIYEILFPNYTIIPLEGCSNVINYTRAFNKIPNKNSTAIGIVDRDFRTDEQINKFISEKIYVYSVAEIENLFLLEDFIQIFAKNKKEIIDIHDLKKGVLNRLEIDKEKQICNYVTSYINYVFSEEHVKKAENKQEIENNFHKFIAKIEIDDLYNKRRKEIEEIINEKDYSKAIKVYNNKGLLDVVENLLRYKPNTYRFKALDILREEKDIQQILRAVFPQEITNA